MSAWVTLKPVTKAARSSGRQKSLGLLLEASSGLRFGARHFPGFWDLDKPHDKKSPNPSEIFSAVIVD
jgi:hypothetical protein